MTIQSTVLTKLEKAKKRHALALALADLDKIELSLQLAHTRALVEVLSGYLSQTNERVVSDQKSFQTMQAIIKILDPDIRRGQKLIVSAKNGHAKVHGTQQEKETKKLKMLEVCKRIANEKPRWEVTSILDEAASQLGCSRRTIYRNLPGIKNKLRPT